MRWKSKYSSLMEDIRRLKAEIEHEIDSQPKHPNIGKRGCLKRVNQIIQFHNNEAIKW